MDLLPWITQASQYSGGIAAVAGIAIFIQNLVQTYRTRAKLTSEIGAVESRVNKKIDEAEKREDIRHNKLEEKQERILKAIGSKLHALELEHANMRTTQVASLGKLAERMAAVESEVHALRNGRK